MPRSWSEEGLNNIDVHLSTCDDIWVSSVKAQRLHALFHEPFVSGAMQRSRNASVEPTAVNPTESTSFVDKVSSLSYPY